MAGVRDLESPLPIWKKYELCCGTRRGGPHYVCTGAYLCQPLKPKPMSKEMLARFRLSTNETNKNLDP
jgi:hypothetical protein